MYSSDAFDDTWVDYRLQPVSAKADALRNLAFLSRALSLKP